MVGTIGNKCEGLQKELAALIKRVKTLEKGVTTSNLRHTKENFETLHVVNCSRVWLINKLCVQRKHKGTESSYQDFLAIPRTT